MVYILVRWHRRYSIREVEIISVHSSRKDAMDIASHKNSLHEAVQPYQYAVVAKKLK